MWQAIARHIWIVFGREIRRETSLADLVAQHESLARAITSGSDANAVAEVERHILRKRR